MSGNAESEQRNNSINSVGLVGPITLGNLSDLLNSQESTVLPPGGGGEQVTHLCRELHRRGLRVAITTLSPHVEDVCRLVGDRVEATVIPYRKAHRVRDFFAEERHQITSAVQESSVDVVHAHWTYEYALGALANMKHPVLVTVRDWAPAVLKHQPTTYRALRLLMQWWTFKKGRHFTAASPYIATKIDRLPWASVRLIPNGVPDKLFSSPKSTPPSETPTLISVNNGWGRLKNVPTLLRAFASIRTEIPSVELRLIGQDHEFGGPAWQWATQQHLDDGVRFVGKIQHGKCLTEIKNADILVHPALEESFGNILIEAMAQGTPVIAGARSGAVPWVMDYGRAGILVNVKSAEQLARAVINLLKNGQRWRDMSFAGFTHASRNYRMSHITDLYIETYLNLQETADH